MKHIPTAIIALLLSMPTALAYELIYTDIAYLDFYGEVKARALIKERNSETTLGDSKVGILGKYSIQDELQLVGGTEVEVNLDKDEDAAEDELNVSQYFLGLSSYPLGTLTAGKHNTSSDDFDGVDYSEVYGGRANLNTVGVKTDTLKYRLDREFYQINATYGFESGKQNRDLAELFVKYLDGDIQILGGVGKTSTNTSTSQLDVFYSHVSGFLELGDYKLGTTIYYQNKDDNLFSERSSDKLAFSLAGKLLIIHDFWTYAGYELVNSTSDSESLDGTSHNTYLGLGMRYFEWVKFYGELNCLREATAEDKDMFSIGVGLTLYW